MNADTEDERKPPIPVVQQASPGTGGPHPGLSQRLHQLGEQIPRVGEALAGLASIMPGFAGYKSAEDRRIADKQLRATIGERLSRVKARLDTVIDAQSRGGGLDGLALVDQSGRRLERLIDRMRFADYGYAAVFDRVQMGDPELDRLYNYDAAILAQLGSFDEVVNEVQEAVGDPVGLAAALLKLDSLTADFDRRFDARKHLFDGLATS